MLRTLFCALAFLFSIEHPLRATEPLGGWRGNGTGLWQGNPPLTWQRIPKGALAGLRAQTDRPLSEMPGEAPLVAKGQIRQWLVLGPFPVTNSATDFDQDPLGGETAVQPCAGEKCAGHEWTLANLVAVDDPMVFGTAEMPWLDFTKTIGFKQQPLAGELDEWFMVI